MRNIIFLILITSLSLCANANIVSKLSFADVVEPLMPAVVNVSTIKYAKNTSDKKRNSNFPEGHPFQKFNDLFEHFGDPLFMDDLQNQKTTSLGSGFIVDKQGYIVTNHHVVKDADEINIKLNDNSEYKAELIGSDPRTDVALLKVKSDKDLPYVIFGDSQVTRVGDWIITIGNPFGLGGTVTTGIVSSKSRDIDIAKNGIVDDYIQTDAAINTGNSGGPMFNMQGEVIGVNTAIFSPSGTNIGIGFAIPSNTVKNIVEQLKKSGKVKRGMLGIRIQELTPEIAEGLNIDRTSGSLIVSVDPGGAADKAGIKMGDVIIEYNGHKVTDTRKLQIMVAETPVNSSVRVKVLRSGEIYNIVVKITEKSDDQDSQKDASSKSRLEIAGVIFENLSKGQLSDLNISNGVVVVDKKPQTIWGSIMRGDIIISVNQRKIVDVSDVEEEYNNQVKAEKNNIVFLIKRGSYVVYLAMPIK